jgi:hypothetical protein
MNIAFFQHSITRGAIRNSTGQKTKLNMNYTYERVSYTDEFISIIKNYIFILLFYIIKGTFTSNI